MKRALLPFFLGLLLESRPSLGSLLLSQTVSCLGRDFSVSISSHPYLYMRNMSRNPGQNPQIYHLGNDSMPHAERILQSPSAPPLPKPTELQDPAD